MAHRVDVVLVAEFGAEGGALTYSRMLLSHLLGRGLVVTVIAFGPLDELLQDFAPSSKLLRVAQGEATAITASTVHRYGRNPWGYLLEARKIRDMIKRRGWSPRAIISSVCSPGRFLGVASSENQHIQVHHTYPRGGAHWLAGPIFRWLAGKTVLVGVSSFLSERFNSVWGLRGRRAFVTVPNTVGEPPADVPPFEEREDLILTVGAVSPEKNPHAVIELAVAVRDAELAVGHALPLKFAWLGTGPLLPHMREEVRRHGLGAKVFFEGFQDNPSKWYQKAKAYYQPSAVDSMPLAVLDAFRWGVPAFTSSVGGLPEMLGPDLVSNIVNPEDPTGVAKNVMETVQDFGRWTNQSEALRGRYREHYSPEAWASRMDTLILGVNGEKSNG